MVGWGLRLRLARRLEGCVCKCVCVSVWEMGILGAPLGNGFAHLLLLPPHPKVAMEVCRELLIKQEKSSSHSSSSRKAFPGIGEEV